MSSTTSSAIESGVSFSEFGHQLDDIVSPKRVNTTSAEREQLESVRVPSRRPRDEEATTAEGQIVFELPLQEPHHLHRFILEDWARQLCRVEGSDECDGERQAFRIRPPAG